MKINYKLGLLLFTLTFTSCFFRDYISEKIKSPTENFQIQATVNRNDKKSNDYADVIIHLYSKNNSKLTEINSGVGDANKWAIGWTENGDTIILQSSDIGNKAWVLNEKNPTEIKMSDKLNKRAEQLYLEKFK